MLPSGKFGANAAYYRLVVLTHNVLCAMRRLVVPPELRSARPKRMRFRLFTLPAKVIVHARRLYARIVERLLRAADAVAMRMRTLSLGALPAQAPRPAPA